MDLEVHQYVASSPKFISNLLCGNDKTEGLAQERLVNAIAKHITLTDSKHEKQTPRIIGFKGEWGMGKSNVIKQLKNKRLCRN